MPNPNLPINAQYNTYVGARYVPKFADPIEWDNTQQYEPLTIVLNQGTSYVSKTFVPIGISITNTVYWIPMAQYNAQVAALQNSVNSLLPLQYYQGNYVKIINILMDNNTASADKNGLCTLVQTSDGKNILIDAGRNSSSSLIVSQLENFNVQKIDYCFISHWHLDHMGALETLKNNFNMTNTIFYIPLTTPKYPETDNNYGEFTQLFANNTKIFPNENDSLQIDNNGEMIYFRFNNCGPTAFSYYNNYSGTPSISYNDYCMVVSMQYGNDISVFPGDLTSVGQSYLYNQNYLKHADFMIAPHHGDTGNGIQGAWKFWNPSVCFDPVYGVQYSTANVPGRSEFLCLVSHLGAYCIIGAYQYEPVVITSTGNGILVGSHIPTPVRHYASNKELVDNVYVNETYTGSYSDGSQKYPYASLITALAKCGTYPTLITLMSDISTTAVFEGLSDVTVNFNGFKINGQITIKSSQGITLNQCKTTGLIVQKSNATLYQSIIDNPITIQDSQVFLNDLTISNVGDICVNCIRSLVTVNSILCTANKAAICSTQSFVTCISRGSDFTKGATNARILWENNGIAIANNSKDGASGLTNLWYYTAENFNLHFLYDNTNSKPGYLAADGTFKYLTTE